MVGGAGQLKKSAREREVSPWTLKFHLVIVEQTTYLDMSKLHYGKNY